MGCVDCDAEWCWACGVGTLHVAPVNGYECFKKIRLERNQAVLDANNLREENFRLQRALRDDQTDVFVTPCRTYVPNEFLQNMLSGQWKPSQAQLRDIILRMQAAEGTVASRGAPTLTTLDDFEKKADEIFEKFGKPEPASAGVTVMEMDDVWNKNIEDAPVDQQVLVIRRFGDDATIGLMSTTSYWLYVENNDYIRETPYAWAPIPLARRM